MIDFAPPKAPIETDLETRLSLNERSLCDHQVTMAVHTGMRKGELLGLKWEQVNFEQGIITLHDTKTVKDGISPWMNQLKPL